MIALSISDVKGFMVKLLKEDAFDGFLLKNATIDTFARFEIYAAESETTAKWSDVRSYVFDVVKGNAAPKSIKIVLGGDTERTGIENAAALFINIHFENGKVNITTGLSKRSFSLDRTDDEKWDGMVMQFLDAAGIRYTREA
ncbi:MAG: DUF5721 family protein [Defluviitaleaceae bacterium]|nr:DUF5721 family protein [Defluviitaleaceae bacterium]